MTGRLNPRRSLTYVVAIFAIAGFIAACDIETYDDALASTMSVEEGQFAFLGVEPGVYDLLAVRGAASGRAFSLQVKAGSITEAEVSIE